MPSHTIPPDSALQHLLADAGKALSLGQPELARQALRQVLAKAPDQVNAQILYGVACLMHGDFAEAVSFLQKAARQRP